MEPAVTVSVVLSGPDTMEGQVDEEGRRSRVEEGEEQSEEDENQNLLTRSQRSDSLSLKNSLQVPGSRGRSLSHPISPNSIKSALYEACGVRRLSESSRLSYQTFDWDSAKLSTLEAPKTRMENILKDSFILDHKSDESELSVGEVQAYVEEVQKEYIETLGCSFNNSAQDDSAAQRRRKAFLRMTSLNSDLSIEREVRQREQTWGDEVDAPVADARVPFLATHAEAVPYQAKSRKVFIPSTPVYIKIADCGRVHSTLHLNPNLYYIEISHGPCCWTVRRRYNHFLRLHEELILYKARLHIPLGRESHRERHQIFRELPDDVNDLPHFPRTLDALVRSHQLPKRMLQLEKYLQGVANNPLYRNHPKTLEFLEVSHMSFIDELGEKGKEGWVMKRSGGRRVQLGACSCLSCPAQGHYSKRWLLLKDSFVAYVRPSDGALRAVLLMDRDFRVACGREHTGLAHGLQITNTYRHLLVRCNHKAVAREWLTDITQTAGRCEYTYVCPHGSFAPPREGTRILGFADGAEYCRSVADAMEAARQQILILDWCLNPMIYLKRPAAKYGSHWRLDVVLRRKARQGVKIFVLLYKEVEMALGLGSYQTKKLLLGLHPNIKVLRHPDHVPGGAGVMLWAHHEKAVIVDQELAFLGGIDLCYGRWDDHNHRLVDTGATDHRVIASDGEGEDLHDRTQGADYEGAAHLWVGKDYCNFIIKDVVQPERPFEDTVDRTCVPRMPWHDIAAVVDGQAALDVARHFIQRWNFTKEQKFKELPDLPLLIPKSSRVLGRCSFPREAQAVSCTCQILRSACQWSVGVTETEDSIHQAYLRVISASKHYIYIENQFFISIANDPDVSNEIADALFERIIRAHRTGETFRVYVVMPLLPSFEGEVGGDTGGSIHAILHWEYRSVHQGDNAILQRLLQAGVSQPEDYINFYGLRTHAVLGGKLVSELVYIHSKLLIADDNTVILGSANINDRSMLGKRDSELAVLVKDTETVASLMNGQHYEAGRFGLHFRQQLFREHLGVLGGQGEVDVTDPVSDSFYDQTWNKIAYTNTKIYEEVFKCLPTNRVTTFAGLQQYRLDPPLSQNDPAAADQRLLGVKGHLVMTPLEFLCREDLMPSITTQEGIAPTKLWT